MNTEPEPNDVLHRLSDFRAIRYRWLHFSLRALPWILLGVVLIVVFAADALKNAQISEASRIQYITGIFTAATAIFTFNVLLRQIPKVLATLWIRDIIHCKSSAIHIDFENHVSSGDELTPAQGIKVEKAYLIFINNLETQLNHPRQWLMGAGFAILVLTWSSTYEFEGARKALGILSYGGLIVQPLAAVAIGIMAWRMLVVAVNVWQLARKFDLALKLGHPDRCGGLEPLGDLCLWNALVVSVAGIFLGGWLIAYQIEAPIFAGLASNYKALYSHLLVIPVLFCFYGLFSSIVGYSSSNG
jgi:hypothetical protein